MAFRRGIAAPETHERSFFIMYMILPVALVVICNVFYNLCTKYTPEQANPFLSLTVTYIVAAIVSFFAFCLSGQIQNIGAEMAKLNRYSFILGLSVIGLEVGYIYMYRAGWKISTGSLVANISLACILIFVGILLFKEHITLKQMIGIGVCIVGLILITK